MPDLVSPSDKKLLADYGVQVEVDVQQKCGFIIFDNRRFKVTLESRKNEKGSAFKPVTLEAEQMKETANKVAVMLLKKEYLQIVNQKPMKFLINATVIAFRSEKEFRKHEDEDVRSDTRLDYDDLAKYVNKYLPKEEAAKPDQGLASDADEMESLSHSEEDQAERGAVNPKAGIGKRRYYHTNRTEDLRVGLTELAQPSKKKEDEKEEPEIPAQKAVVQPSANKVVDLRSTEDEFHDSLEEDDVDNRGLLSRIGNAVYDILRAGSE